MLLPHLKSDLTMVDPNIAIAKLQELTAGHLDFCAFSAP
jgi:hypothetical protein